MKNSIGVLKISLKIQQTYRNWEKIIQVLELNIIWFYLYSIYLYNSYCSAMIDRYCFDIDLQSIKDISMRLELIRNTSLNQNLYPTLYFCLFVITQIELWWKNNNQSDSPDPPSPYIKLSSGYKRNCFSWYSKTNSLPKFTIFWILLLNYFRGEVHMYQNIPSRNNDHSIPFAIPISPTGNSCSPVRLYSNHLVLRHSNSRNLLVLGVLQ